uniref:Uncharacterized protein n=1 Tax=Steinernema glaseri TaxID=37863 RepID=A0A1I7YFB3_9BILA
MDRVPVLFVVEVCRQLGTKHSSAVEELPYWKDVSRDLFNGLRKVTGAIYCSSETPDVGATASVPFVKQLQRSRETCDGSCTSFVRLRENFLTSMIRIRATYFDNWPLVAAIAGKVAERGTLQELALRSLDRESDVYKDVLRKFSKCESLILFHYYDLIKPNIELSDEEKAHFRMEEKPEEYAIDFVRISD